MRLSLLPKSRMRTIRLSELRTYYMWQPLVLGTVTFKHVLLNPAVPVFNAGSFDVSFMTKEKRRIAQAGALPSFSRPGNPYDNALPGTTQTEAGWSTLKTELLHHGPAFASLEEAQLEVAHYLDTYFNVDRHHSALGRTR